MHVHRQPCQMFSGKAVSEGREKHKYFVTFFLGSFSGPGIPRGLHCIELRPSHLHTPSSCSLPHPVLGCQGTGENGWWGDRNKTFSEVAPILRHLVSKRVFYQNTTFSVRRPQGFPGHVTQDAMVTDGTRPRKYSVQQESRVSQSLLRSAPGMGKIWK